MKTCTSCHIDKPLTSFNKDKNSKDKLRSICRGCQKEYSAKYHKTYKGNSKRKDYLLQWRYGISEEVLDKMYLQQEGKCAICGEFKSTYNKKGGLYIDHCHTTGKVRGLLCNYCNSVIGMAKENTTTLLKAIEYLIKKKG